MRKTIFYTTFFLTLLTTIMIFQKSNTVIKKPNVLWLVCEDESLFFPFYGDTIPYTPNLSKLANDGIIYDNFFTTSPVCAPSRSSIITGMYPTTLGTQNMRAFKKGNKGEVNAKTLLPIYSTVPEKKCIFFTEILREKGYYCTNNSKEDYNMSVSPLAWDESSTKAHWRNRKKNQPFFSVFNFNITHESMLWKNKVKITEDEINNIRLPSIFPNNISIKKDFLRNYKNIEILDTKVGEIIEQLKEDGLYENTVIFFFSDHGGPFPRYKRSIYDTGIKCPLVIKWIDEKITNRNDQMISFIDLAPTILDLTAIKNNVCFEGISFFKSDNRTHIFAATDRMDESITKRRCIRNKKYKLIINYDSLNPIHKPNKYRSQMVTMHILDSLNGIQKSSHYFNKWFNEPSTTYELYDIKSDLYEEHNLYGDSTYKRVFESLNNKLELWINSSDFGNLKEEEIIKKIWPNNKKPFLNNPDIENFKNGKIIRPNNEGISIGWKNKNDSNWKIYKVGEVIHPIKEFEVIIFKMGYDTVKKLFRQ